MAGELRGIRVVEVGGAVAVPAVGMLNWGAEVIHVEPPGKGDNWRHVLGQGMAGRLGETPPGRGLGPLRGENGGSCARSMRSR